MADKCGDALLRFHPPNAPASNFEELSKNQHGSCCTSNMTKPLVASPSTTCGSAESSNASSEEAALIREILNGRRELFWELLEPHTASLERFVRVKLQNDADTGDVLQEIYLKVLTRLHQFRYEATFKTWLMKIAMNEIRPWFRKAKFARLAAVDINEIGPISATVNPITPYHQCERREQVTICTLAVDRLPESYRIVILMRDVQDYKLAEIARRLQLNLSTVKSRERRARGMMRRFTNHATSRRRGAR